MPKCLVIKFFLNQSKSIFRIILILHLILVNGEEISSIGRGICALVGLSRDDTEKEVDYM